MGCNLGVGKVWSSTRNPVDQIMGAKTNGRQVHFAVELRRMAPLVVNNYLHALWHTLVEILQVLRSTGE